MSDSDPSAADETRDNQDEQPKPDKPNRPRGRSRQHKKTETEEVAAGEAGGTGNETGESVSHDNDSMERAERIVQQWTVRAEQVGTEIGHHVVKLFARAREEAEDIWAEAQEIRHRQEQQANDQQQEQQHGTRD